jgi:hypothetical protein
MFKGVASFSADLVFVYNSISSVSPIPVEKNAISQKKKKKTRAGICLAVERSL